MKTHAHLAPLAALVATLPLVACVGPAARHDARLDRRGDAVDRAENRVDTRQGNRYDRRTDRVDRIDSRYGY